MKLLTTLLLIFSTMYVQAQEVENTSTTETNALETVSTVASEIKKAEAVNVFIDYDDELDQHEKMSVSVKQKRHTDKFIDTDHVYKLLLAFLINLVAIMIIVRWLYYPKCKRGEFFFTYILIAISTFMLIYVLGDVKLKAGIALGLFAMFLSKGMGHIATLILFGISGFVMITGYIFVTALCGSMVRDHTPDGAAGKLQGVRMVFSVLIPMIIGPMIGNSINKAMGNLMENPGADAMTTEYIPAPEIFLVGGIATLVLFLVIPFLTKYNEKKSEE